MIVRKPTRIQITIEDNDLDQWEDYKRRKSIFKPPPGMASPDKVQRGTESLEHYCLHRNNKRKYYEDSKESPEDSWQVQRESSEGEFFDGH